MAERTPRFMDLSPQDRAEQAMFERPVPGESLTQRPQKFPFDRPPEFSDAEEAFDFLFDRLMEPETFRSSVALMDSGAPLDVMVSTVLKTGFGEGLFHPSLLPILAVPVTVLFTRIAEAAGIDFKLSNDAPEGFAKVSEAEVTAAMASKSKKEDKARNVAESSREDLKETMKNEGLMSRPEAIS